jgi:short subunit dehydrogenase-like uncharacterized protein
LNVKRPYDVALYGATGFVGRQTVAHFAAHADGVRWALAGRSAAKLEQVRQANGPGAAGAGIIVADAADKKALDALASQTFVVLSTAGPFALYGSALVAACVAHRTHYVDITGETPWVRGLIDRHHAQAARDGTRIIPGCGVRLGAVGSRRVAGRREDLARARRALREREGLPFDAWRP